MNNGQFVYPMYYINRMKERMFIFTIFARMEKTIHYYKENIEAYGRRSAALKKRMHLAGTIRLALTVGAGLVLWLAWSESWAARIGILLLFLLPFAALMIYHNRLAWRKEYTDALIHLNQNELKGLAYDFGAFDGAPEKIAGDHSFSLDLDVFGEQSLFQSINRTVTFPGKELLADWFLHPFSSKEDILSRQEAVRELASHTQLRQHFYVTGSLRQGNKNDLNILTRLTGGKRYFIDRPLWKGLIWVIPAGWLAIAVGYAGGWLAGAWGSLFFLISVLAAYGRSKQVNDLYNSVNKMERILSTYSDLMKSFEGDTFQSEELTTLCRRLTDGKTVASEAIRQLSGYIGALDQRFSLAGIILNIFYLRDMRHALLLEKWKQKHADDLARWFDTLGRFDALCSLGGFAFNHPEYSYPQIADHYFKMEGKGLGHPLLDRKVCVKNDIDIPKNPWFLIITGANMAGKSTYLRTVGVNYLLACMGAPVCADSLTVYPAQLVTSLRTSDSLASNESYFFAELKRLKMMIDRLQKGEKLFIILDEILKGTNSVDKQKGSLALMKQLVAYRSCGIIATHDLVLGTLENEFPEEIKNYRFEADIQNNELSFSYRLREGIAQNMNACFLMKKMGIVVEG